MTPPPVSQSGPTTPAPGEVVLYLLRRRLVSARAVVGGDLVAVESSGRNRVIRIMWASGPGYLLKQGLGPAALSTVAHEGRVYHRFQSNARYAVMRPYLVHSYGYDRQRRVLILELPRGARPLGEHFARTGRFPARIAATMGDALGTFHRATWISGGGSEADYSMNSQPPWILSIHRPGPGVLQSASLGTLRLVQIVQETPVLGGLLGGLRAEWRSLSLVHNDLKWENLLLCPRPGSRRRTELKIVDWELAAVGDPRWDAGTIFAEYLGFWLLSIPIAEDEPPERFMDLARVPLAAMQPATRAFWDAYSRRMGLDGAAAASWLVCAVRYAAARLIQTAYEHLQGELRMSGGAVLLTQLALNILRRPGEAADHLLGIPWRRASLL